MRRPNQFNIPPYVTTFLLFTLLLSHITHAYPTTPPLSDLNVRQHDHGNDHHHETHHGDHVAGIAGMMDDAEALTSSSPSVTDSMSSATIPTPPDPHAAHGHGSHSAPKDTLDDVDIHFWHKFPPTYLAADFRLDNDSAIFGEDFDEAWDPETASGHKGLLLTHVGGFYTAYLGLLPVALALRAADHRAHYIVNTAFLVLATLGWLSGAVYSSSTPDRYEGSVYPKFVNILLLTSYVLDMIDSLRLISKAFSSSRVGRQIQQKLSSLITRSSHQSLELAYDHETEGLIDERENPEIHEEPEHHVVFALEDETEEDEAPRPRTLSKSAPVLRRPSLLRQWSPPSRQSTTSERTLHDSPTSESPAEGESTKYHARDGVYDAQEEAGELEHAPKGEGQTKSSRLAGLLQKVLTWIRRSQVVFAYVTLIIGISTYTGMCRGSYINSCVAHYIKGSIFFGYGLLTFARYLGAYADLGWAWNRRPGKRVGPSAEMVECAVIFTYGITNTWLERLGAAPGSPYNVKQVQHISIAVMFWFAGLSGMLLESKTIRRLLGAAKGGKRSVDQPHSYVFSFNPLPALVIAVTGLAMAAHHQNYIFQVEIHKLWGILLAGGSAFRFLTYFFLFIRPPTESTLPSRPPTEILTAFGWAAGGIVFMLSNEEICFAAMRAGYDDMMAFLNFTIALTSLVFCWTLVVLAIKGWAVSRNQQNDGEVGVTA